MSRKMAGVLRIVRRQVRTGWLAGYEHGSVKCGLLFGRFVLSTSPDESGLFIHFIEPAAAIRENMVETCGIRLDVEYGRSVEYVDTANGQQVAAYAEQFDDTQTDRIGAQWGAGGEDAMFGILQKRFDHQFGRAGAMQMVNEIKMRKTFDIFQTGGIGWKYFQRALTVLCEYRLRGCLLRKGMFTVDDADR